MDPTGRLIQNVINLERIGNTLTAEAQGRIQRLFAEIAADLAAIDPTGPAQATYRTGRLNEFLDRLAKRLRDFQGAEVSALKDRLAVVARLQAKHAEADLVATLGAKAKQVVPAPMTQQVARGLLNSDPFMGRLLAEQVDRLGANVLLRVRDQVRMGMAAEESIGDMVRRVRGTQAGWLQTDQGKVPRFVGGVVNTTTREAEAIVRTGVSHVANEGMDATYQANQRFLSGVRFTATLDDRTTAICLSLDGTEYALDDPDRPRFPLHWGERSVYVPVVDWQKLGLEPPPEPPRMARDLSGVSEADLQRKVSARRRTSDLGKQVKVSSATHAEQWLRRQPARVADKMLGVGRAKLWRRGDYTLAEMIRQDNSLVPLHELQTAN